MSLDWWPSIHGLRYVNPIWGHHVCNGRDLHGSVGLGPGTGKGALPPGAAPDRLGTSGQIWEGNADGGEQGWDLQRGSNPAAGQFPRIHHSRLIYKQGRNLAAGQSSACGLLLLFTWLLSISVSWPARGKVKHLKLPYGLKKGSLISLPQALFALAHPYEQWIWEYAE